jgi:alcohol dehydrogenase class IV
MPPLIAVPTTAGSGSEIGRAALLTLAGGDKVAFISRYLLPAAVICDPALTVAMPAALTAGSGMDAIAHGIEAFLSPRRNPVADAIALDGLARGMRSLRRAVERPDDLAARAEMMWCSLEGGLAFQKGLGAVHSLSHPLGALGGRRLHHGTLNAVFLPHVLRFNLGGCRDGLAAIAARCGFAGAEAVADEVERLRAAIGLPARLRDLGVLAADLPPLAEKAFADHCTPTNPRPLAIEDLRDLYLRAW